MLHTSFIDCSQQFDFQIAESFGQIMKQPHLGAVTTRMTESAQIIPHSVDEVLRVFVHACAKSITVSASASPLGCSARADVYDSDMRPAVLARLRRRAVSHRLG